MSNLQLPAIRKIARIHDKATGKYFDVVEFPVSDLQSDRLELLPSVVNDQKVFTKELRDGGALLDKDKDRLKQQLEAVAQSDPPEEWIYEDHTGWTEDRNAFVMAKVVIGEVATKIIGVNQSNAIKDRSGQLGLKGGWKTWRETVAEPCRYSTTLMVAVSAALGAPLLAFTGEQSFSLNLFGPTRAGKSVATLVAGSIIGSGRLEDLISWKLTNARLEERLPEFNDTIFPIDDLDKIKGNQKVKYERIRELAYSISQGSATGRHSSWTAAHEGAHRSWSSIVLTSCEHSVHKLAQAAKMERQHGEALRLIDVPAIFGGQDHIFDRMPSTVSNAEDWKGRTFAAFAEACEQNHGKPFRKYIKALIARRATVKEDIAQCVNAFVGCACDKFDGAVARDVARKFGLIYAGGLFGIQCRLLPWKEAELRGAILKSFHAARELLPDKGVLLRTGLVALQARRRKLQSVSMPFTNHDAGKDWEHLPGFKVSLPGAFRYVIRVEFYNQMFSSTEQRDLVTDRLIQKNRITLANPGQSPSISGRTPKEQHFWPDGKRHRSIEIIWKKKNTSSRTSV